MEPMEPMEPITPEARAAVDALMAPDRYAVLAEARKALREMEGEWDRTVASRTNGRCAEACAAAEDAIFHALNTLANYGDDDGARAVLDA